MALTPIAFIQWIWPLSLEEENWLDRRELAAAIPYTFVILNFIHRNRALMSIMLPITRTTNVRCRATAPL